QISNLESQINRLDRLADQIEAANPESAMQLRDQAQGLRDQLTLVTDQQNADLQARFDESANEHRKIAIRRFALAIHLARQANIPTSYAARALERLRLEEMRPLIDDAVTGIPDALRNQIGFKY